MFTKIVRRGAVLPLVALGLGLSAASAGETIGSLIANGLDAACAAFGAIVSASEGNFGTRNQFGCAGAFQFCPGTLVQYFAGTVEEFLGNPKAQTVAWTNYEKTQWQLAKNGGLTSLIGEVLTFGAKSVTIDASAILMACQFGCGKFGKLGHYVSSHDCNSASVKDGNGVSVCTYLVKGAGQVVSCFTGEQPGPKPPPVPVPIPAVPTPTLNVACAAGGEFGTEGPLEIVAGQYTLRFGSSATADTIKKYLQILERK